MRCSRGCSLLPVVQEARDEAVAQASWWFETGDCSAGVFASYGSTICEADILTMRCVGERLLLGLCAE